VGMAALAGCVDPRRARSASEAIPAGERVKHRASKEHSFLIRHLRPATHAMHGARYRKLKVAAHTNLEGISKKEPEPKSPSSHTKLRP
jgi:hypothetical protein